MAVGHVAQLRHFVGDIVEADGEEVGEHDFGDRPQARHRGAHRGAENRLFGDRRVSHAQRSELLVEADRRLEHAARLADVLAKEDDVVVALASPARCRARRRRDKSVPPRPAPIRIDIRSQQLDRRRRRSFARERRRLDLTFAFSRDGIDRLVRDAEFLEPCR